MSLSRKFLAAAGFALMLGGVAAAQSPACTLFAQNNGGSAGGAVYFQVTTKTDICITAFDTNLSDTYGPGVGNVFAMDVYLTAQGVSYSGNETTPTAWTWAASGTGIQATADTPSHFVLASPISLGIGTYGMMLFDSSSVTPVGHKYTSIGGTWPTTTGDLTIDTGSAYNVPWGGVFTPRSWNGCIYFNKYGLGCPGSGGCTPDLAMEKCPVAGSTIAIHVTKGLGGNLAFFFLGTGMGPVKMGGGCSLNLSKMYPVSFAVPLAPSGPCVGEVHFKALIPAAATGAKVNMQVFIPDKGSPGGMGFSNSNGLEINIQ